MSEIVLYSSCVCLIALSRMSSEFIHVVTRDRISFFFFKVEEYSIIYTYNIFFSDRLVLF